ncbi:Rv1733c family protein [Streptomyces aureus]
MRTRIRGWRWRRNPLRRRSDVVEAWWALAVGVLLLVGAPLAGAGAARWTYEGAQTHSAARQAAQQHVRAVLLEDTPTAVTARPGGRPRSLSADVRWRASDGKQRTARVPVPPGLRRGEHVDVWTDARGAIVHPAPSRSMMLQQALAIGVFTVAGVTFTVSAAHLCVRRALGRRRLARWEQEWARTEPDWSRRAA